MKYFLLICLSLMTFACSTTKQLDHWQSDNFKRGDLNNVLIIGATNNQANRFIFESELERRLVRGGLRGVKSLDVMGTDIPNREAVEAYVAGNDIDYIVATRFEGADVETSHIPPSAVTYYTGPYYPSYGAFYDYGNSITLVREGYVDTRTSVILLTTIFDAKSGEAVWDGRSSSFEPGSIANLAGDIARSTWTSIAG